MPCLRGTHEHDIVSLMTVPSVSIAAIKGGVDAGARAVFKLLKIEEREKGARECRELRESRARNPARAVMTGVRMDGMPVQPVTVPLCSTYYLKY